MNSNLKKHNIDTNQIVIIKNKINSNEVLELVSTHVNSNLFKPLDFKEKSEFRAEVIWIPSFYYNGNYTNKWSVFIGMNKTTYYTDYRTVTEYRRKTLYQGGIEIDTDEEIKRTVPFTNSRIDTDWHPISGIDHEFFNLLFYAGKDNSYRKIVEEANYGDLNNLETIDYTFFKKNLVILILI
ncbi:MAG: hypothetical protein ACKN9F_01735 [Methylomonas sp.]